MSFSKIVHVTPVFLPTLGGVEKVVYTLAREQSKKGMNVMVVAPGQRMENDFLSEQFTVYRLKYFDIFNTNIMPGLFFKLLNLNRKDIVHLHVTQAYTPEMVWITSKLKGFRYIAHIHLDVPPSGPAGFLLKIYKPFILKRVLRSAAYVVVFSEDQKTKVIKRYKITPYRVRVIPNGVEGVFYYDRLRKIHKLPRLLFVGRLNFQKNLQQFLEALENISELFDTTLVGEGELENELKQLARKLKLKNLSFVGRADGENLINYYKRSDIFVLPSEREGMPLVLLEAMAMGLPIVATDVTGSRDLVKNRKNGLLVPLNDGNAMRSALIKIGSDNALYQKMSNTSKKLSYQYSWDKVIEEFEKLYIKTYHASIF